MKKYDYILFDLDDTLIDNLENVRHAYKKMPKFDSCYLKISRKARKNLVFYLFYN